MKFSDCVAVNAEVTFKMVPYTNQEVSVSKTFYSSGDFTLCGEKILGFFFRSRWHYLSICQTADVT